ncbi:MAG: polyribonucleotide nucleotidyltransferase, partial [Opitutales bacterium]
VRLAEIDGEFVVNPTNDQIFDSTLDLIYVGNEKEMMMIEGSAEFISDERFYEALEYGQKAIQPIIAAQRELAKLAGKEKKEFPLVITPAEVTEFCEEFAAEKVKAALAEDSYSARKLAIEKIADETTAALEEKLGAENVDGNDVARAFDEIQEKLYRQNILDTGKRVDGRGAEDLRAISCDSGVLPRVHGSAIFNRGETQALVISTLGTSRDTQDIDGLTGGATSKSFILHYNFPPFSTGEAGRFGFTSRREQGHGALAERSLLPILPPEDEFPYAIRVVSEVMSSNGSTSMASICGGCLSLMDAGVPITAPCAGISTGLVTEKDADGNIIKSVILTDILGAEDHFGDMDFKIAGTKDGITGFQLDLKISGLPFDITLDAIKQNRDARMKILAIMAEHLPESRQDLREHAPRIHTIKIDPEKIGALIGPGGKNIRRITEVSGAQVDIDDDNSGKVLIFATDKESMDRAIQEVELCTAEIEVGKTYRGIVRGVKEFGAFVECLPGKEGLVHISELADFRVNKTEDICKLGDEMVVKCIGVEKGKVRLSRKAALEDAKEESEEEAPEADEDE